MLSTTKKSKLIAKFQTHKKDTGSCLVQIALLNEKIKELTNHLKKHAKDNHSRRGLLKMVAKRRKLLEYLKIRDLKAYEALIKKIEVEKK